MFVKRIALALGNSLLASNGDFWASQRRMIQPAFTKGAVSGLSDAIAAANSELLAKWKRAAERGETVNVTQDVGLLVLKVTLISIFGDDYEAVASHFAVVADKSARNLEFTHHLAPVGKLIQKVSSKGGARAERPWTTLAG